MDYNTDQPNQAQSLSFTEAEAQIIISQYSLFEDRQTDTPTVSLDDRKLRMKYPEKNCIHPKWHEMASSEYWPVEKNSLRTENEKETQRKWEEILNTCCLDLTLLSTEQSKQETLKVNSELQDVKTTPKIHMDTKSFDETELKLKEELKNL